MERRPGLTCLRLKFSSAMTRKSADERGLVELTREALAIDGFTTSAVAFGEVATLEHEIRNYTVEGRSLIAKTVLARCEFAKVLRSLRNDVIEEFENDAPSGLTADSNVKLKLTDSIQEHKERKFTHEHVGHGGERERGEGQVEGVGFVLQAASGITDRLMGPIRSSHLISSAHMGHLTNLHLERATYGPAASAASSQELLR